MGGIRKFQILQIHILTMTNEAAMWLINKIVATNFGMKVSEITIKTRRAEVVRPRQIAQDLCYELLDITQEEVAKFYKMNRSTLVHSFETVKDNRDTGREYDLLYRKLKRICEYALERLSKFNKVKEAINQI